MGGVYAVCVMCMCVVCDRVCVGNGGVCLFDYIAALNSQ